MIGTEVLEENQAEYVDSGTATVPVPPRFTLTLPDRSQTQEIANLAPMLTAHSTQRGVKTFSSILSRYIKQTNLTDKYWNRMTRLTSAINGMRTPNQARGDKKRSLRTDAQDFYYGLDTAALRLHCDVFKLDYDQFGCASDIVAALVQKHVDMVGTVQE